MPLPLSQDTDYFRTLSNSWSGNAEKVELVYEPTYRAAIVTAVFKPGETRPSLDVVSRFATRERNVELKPGAGMQATREEQALYLKATELMPTDGIVKKTADEITRGARTRRAEGARDLRLDRREHLPRAQDARLRRRRHQGDARDRQHGRQVRRHQRAVRRRCAAPGRRSGARRLRHSRRASRAFGYKSWAPAADITRRSTAAPRSGSQAIGWVAVDPADVGKVDALEERRTGSTTTHGRSRCAARCSAAGKATGSPTTYAHDVRAAGLERAPARLLHVSAGGDARRAHRQPRSGQLQVPDRLARTAGLVPRTSPRAARAA